MSEDKKIILKKEEGTQLFNMAASLAELQNKARRAEGQLMVLRSDIVDLQKNRAVYISQLSEKYGTDLSKYTVNPETFELALLSEDPTKVAPPEDKQMIAEPSAKQ